MSQSADEYHVLEQLAETCPLRTPREKELAALALAYRECLDFKEIWRANAGLARVYAEILGWSEEEIAHEVELLCPSCPCAKEREAERCPLCTRYFSE